MTTLYHFTSTHHLPFIMAHGRLMTTESNLSHEQYAAASCVWFTTDPEPGGKHGLCGGSADKEEIRITVEVPDDLVVEWAAWATKNHMTSDWRKVLLGGGGGKSVADTWRMVFQSVPSSMWVSVENMTTGEKCDFVGAGDGMNQHYFDFAEANIREVVLAFQYGLRGGIMPSVTEANVCQLLAEWAVARDAIEPSGRADLIAWLEGSLIPSTVLSAVYASLTGEFQTRHMPDGTIAVVYSPSPQVPQMNRAQRRAMAKNQKRVA